MGWFSEDFIARVREANDIVQIAESYNIPLKRAGSNYLALCPFHNEKTPSFNINPAQQFFKCFGCDAKGDVITFVRLLERVEFKEAVELLAARAGLEVKYERGGAGQQPAEKDYEAKKALLWANSKALEYFEEMLRHEREGRIAREYLRGRGFTEGTIGDWRLGWSPDRWDGLLQYLVKAGGESKREKVIQAALAAGVLRRKEDGREPYDAFRGRVMFPIFDMQNRPIGFGGRVLEEKPEAGGKYINTSEGKLFEKRKLLYGLNFAAKEIGLRRETVVVEGYTDTIMCHQYGMRNVVATLGTSLTREHIQKLRRHVQQGGRVLALFDADEAGQRATERAVRLFMEEDLPLRVARGLAVKDACEYLPKFGAESFAGELAKAEDSFSYTLKRETTSAGSDLNRQAEAAGRVMELVNLCPNAVKREMMRKEVASAFRVPEEALPRPQAKNPARKPAERPGLAPEKPEGLIPHFRQRNTGRERRERRLLEYMAESAGWCKKIVDEIPPEGFNWPPAAELARQIRDSWQGGARPEIGRIKQLCTTEGADALAVDLLVPEHDLAFSEAELAELVKGIVQEKLDAELDEVNERIVLAEKGRRREELDTLLVRKLELSRKRNGL